jgi:hypothetical protein
VHRMVVPPARQPQHLAREEPQVRHGARHGSVHAWHAFLPGARCVYAAQRPAARRRA